MIKCPRKPREVCGIPEEFHKPPEGEGHLITNFRHIMVLVCNIIVNEGIASGVSPVLNAV